MGESSVRRAALVAIDALRSIFTHPPKLVETHRDIRGTHPPDDAVDGACAARNQRDAHRRGFCKKKFDTHHMPNLQPLVDGIIDHAAT